MPTKLSPKDLQQSALPHATAGSLKARLAGKIDESILSRFLRFTCSMTNPRTSSWTRFHRDPSDLLMIVDGESTGRWGTRAAP